MRHCCVIGLDGTPLVRPSRRVGPGTGHPDHGDRRGLDSFLGHVVGMGIPESWTAAVGISETAYHAVAVSTGSLAGLATLAGLAILAYRRRTVGPVFSATTRMDEVMYVFLGVIIALGLYNTVAGVAGQYDYRAGVSVWFRGIFFLQPHPELMARAPLGFQLHARSATSGAPTSSTGARRTASAPARVAPGGDASRIRAVADHTDRHPSSTPERYPVEKSSLTALAREQLEIARRAPSGRSAHTVFGGHDHVLRQTLIALAAGHGLNEHDSPGEATVHVLGGRVLLSTSEHSWEGSPGDLLIVPAARHALDAIEDAVVLLTVGRHS